MNNLFLTVRVAFHVIFRSLALAMTFTGPAVAGILILTPHPDDDIIMAAGVIKKAVGFEEVTVVYLTNGDYNGVSTGLMRQLEAVTAQTQHLGTSEDTLIFLGYPDGRIRLLFGSYPSFGQQYVTPFGQGTTYGNRGLGRMDYHRYRFGASAPYNAANIVLDLFTILSTYRPDHIFTTSEFDNHSDHAYTYYAARQALAELNMSDPSYTPVLHSTLIWTSDPNEWPTATNPRQHHTLIPGLDSTPFNWNERESLDVPSSMQDWNLMANPKYRAIYSHASQASQTGFITRWAHKDEIFWVESPNTVNQPPVAEAGDDQVLGPGAAASLDGSASRDPEGDSLVYTWRQVEGPAVTLINATTANPSFAVPAGLAADTTWAFELRVNDGSLTSAADLVRVTGQVSTPDITGLATVTASSAATGAEQFASKAVDGLVGGYPFDYRLEWASNREKAGAWIRLTWPQAMTIDRVQLFDRPGPNDQMTGAILSFSDGSTVSVPSLQNDAVIGTTVTFAPFATTSVTVTATGASSSTKSVGLAELVVFGVQTVPTVPVMPSGLSAAAVSPSQISLAWSDNATNETGYSVERSLDGSTFTTIATMGADASAFTDNGLAAATVYYYRVLAFNDVGNSGYSNVTSATTLAAPTVPTAPSELAVASVSSSQLNLTWTDNASNETGYRVERSLDGGSFAVIATLGVDASSYANTGLAAATVYYYRVVAFNTAGDSGHSNVASAATQAAATVPANPSGLTVTTVSQSQLNLSWLDNANNETGYRVERSLDGGSFSVVSTLSAGSTSYSDSGLTAATLYYYRVVAFNTAGNSSYSNVASAATLAPPPASSNIALSASVTASSERPNTGQQAVKAIDDIIAGYPVDRTREWATMAERVGAWIRLSWPVPQTVNRVVLYDRPNTDDWVTAGVLTFSDGSTVPVGSLDNRGGPVEVTFTPRQVQSLTFTVNAVGRSTYNIGLAEIQVYSQ